MVCGSANINDRSLLGSRDSEIGVYVKSDNFVSNLRKRLWAEHLGLPLSDPEAMKQIELPASDYAYNYYRGIAKHNTAIYSKIFPVVAHNEIEHLVTLKQIIQEEKGKGTSGIEQLKQIQGHIVDYPLNFLKEESLRLKNVNAVFANDDIFV